MCNRMAGRRAFTITEVVVVIGIVTLVASITLPSLSTARQASQRSVCAANLHAIYQAASLYSSTYGGWMGPVGEIYGPDGPSWGVSTSLPWPACLTTYEPYTESSIPAATPADFYCALGYIPSRALGGRRYVNGAPHSLVWGDEILICPAAQQLFPTLAPYYWGGYGQTRATYFFSSLLMDWPYSHPACRRDNAYGPYRLEELAAPSQTFFSGDGVAMADMASSGLAIGPETPGQGSVIPVDAAMIRHFRYQEVGNPFSCFGAIATAVEYYNNSYCFYAWQYYHDIGPNGLYWDGHTQTVTPPPQNTLNDLYTLRKNLTRNGLDQYP